MMELVEPPRGCPEIVVTTVVVVRLAPPRVVDAPPPPQPALLGFRQVRSFEMLASKSEKSFCSTALQR